MPARFATSLPPSAPRKTYRHRVPLLERRFSYAHRPLVFGHLTLYGDRIELAGWTLRGRQRRSIPLDEIVEMDYHPLREGGNLSMRLASAETLDLNVEEAHLLRETFENWLRYSVLPSAKLLGSQDQATAVAG